ncbi:MAG: efflux RND transporter periplasmic adaptor subunit [Deltaproteobacteria bacterium]|nr:efflux RND transporter periplasmic adaptor subunit [Deltaproteobacteria bacterium]
MKKKIKLGAMAFIAMFILVFAFSYTSTRLKRENSTAKPVLSRVEGLTAGGEKTMAVDTSNETQGMKDESRTEKQMQDRQETPEFVGIEISPEKQQLIGIKTEEVAPRKLAKNIRTVGIVETDERKIEYVQVKFNGWIKDMFVYEGQHVKQGDPLFTIYSPDLVSSQEEYLLALKAKDTLDKSPFSEVSSGANSLLEATKRRFRLWDVPESELKRIARTGEPLTYITMNSPVSGYITKRMAFPGIRISEGEHLVQMADLSTVWIIADVYEYELPLVKEGEEATLELSYYPGETFNGKVIYVYPTIDVNTRTAKVRFEFQNPDHKLKPGMYANVVIQSDLGERLSVAEDAVIDTGERKVVFIASGDGYFEPREIKVGQKADGYYEAIDGLEGGERVVRSAAFFVDSESRLKAAFQSLSGGREETVVVGGGETRAKSDIKISFSTEPDPPKSGNTTFKFRLADPEGKPITDAKVKFAILMPAMPGMAEMSSTDEAKPVGDGVYKGELNIPMSGSWTLGVGALMPGKPPVNESFDINVR